MHITSIVGGKLYDITELTKSGWSCSADATYVDRTAFLFCNIRHTFHSTALLDPRQSAVQITESLELP